MAFTGSSGIWTAKGGDFVVTNFPGDAAGLAAAKAYSSGGGFVEVYPGSEALVPGVFGGSVVSIWIRQPDGILTTSSVSISGLCAADVVDPTRRLVFDLTGVATGTIRVAIVPNYTGILVLSSNVGTATQFLRSGGAGVAPSFVDLPSITNALLDGSNHTDTLAGSVLRGDLIIGNSTPKWARLGIGASGTVLASNGTDVSWSSNPAVQHDTLAHIKAVRATGCGVVNGTATLTTSAGQFASVRVGDLVNFDTATTSLWGASVSALIDTNSVTLDRTNTGSTVAGAVCIITPGDHYNSSITESNGYFIAQGRGDYQATGGGTTFQEIRGPVRWRGYESGHNTDFRVQGSTSVVTPFGFGIEKGVTGNHVYFMVNALTASRVLTVPDASDEIMLVGTTPALGNVTNKTFGAANTILMDETGGTTNGTAFRDRSGTTKGLGFDISGVTAGQNRVAKWPDYGGTVRLDGAFLTFTDTDATPSVALSRCFKASNTGATTITTFDDGFNGQEILILFTNGNTTIQAGANLKTVGGANIVGTADDVVKFVFDGTSWFQSSPVSVNA